MGDEKFQKESSTELLKAERYLWMARAFSVVAVLSFFANILLLIALGSLHPLTRIQPFLLNIQDKNQQVVDISETGIDLIQANEKDLEESFVRQYITARYTVGSDLDELKRRWAPETGLVAVMSNDAVWHDFANSNPTAKTRELYDAMAIAEGEGMTRKIVIDTADKDSEGRWIVYFTAETMRQNEKQPVITKHIAQMRVGFEVLQGMKWGQRLRNPLGFKVLSYGMLKGKD